jgi:hypothetical protein
VFLKIPENFSQRLNLSKLPNLLHRVGTFDNRKVFKRNSKINLKLQNLFESKVVQ